MNDQSKKFLSSRVTPSAVIDFSVLTEGLPFLFSYVDADRRVRYQNKVFETWWGKSPLSVYGKSFQEVVGDQRYAELKPYVDRVLNGEKVIFETNPILKDGTPHVLDVTYLPDISADGIVKGFFVRAEDITERKRAEERLRKIDETDGDEARLYLASIVESSDDVIISKSLEGIIQSWNKGAERIFGYRPEEIVGKSILTLIPPDRHPEEAEILARVKTGQRVEHYETVRRTKDGRQILVSLAVSPIKDKQGKIIGISKIARDITRQRMTEDLNKELEEFAYVASHDLQEPLRTVALYSQMMDLKYKDSLDGDARSYLGFITSGVKRMQRLIQDLLLYSRTGKDGATREIFDLTDVVHEVLGDLEQAISDAKAEIMCNPLPRVHSSRFQMRQLLQNLIGNSIKFTADGTPKVHISGRLVDSSAVISVTDNGIGIDPEFHDKVFRVFQRLHGREEYSGTGIGLAVCKKIVEQHGGRIWITSRAGEGATFSFSLPGGSDRQPAPSQESK